MIISSLLKNNSDFFRFHEKIIKLKLVIADAMSKRVSALVSNMRHLTAKEIWDSGLSFHYLDNHAGLWFNEAEWKLHLRWENRGFARTHESISHLQFRNTSSPNAMFQLRRGSRLGIYWTALRAPGRKITSTWWEICRPFAGDGYSINLSRESRAWRIILITCTRRIVFMSSPWPQVVTSLTKDMRTNYYERHS